MKKCSLIPFAVLAAAAGAGAAVGRKLKTDKAFRRDFDDAVGKGILAAVISIPVTVSLPHPASAAQGGVSATPAAVSSPTTTIRRSTT